MKGKKYFLKRIKWVLLCVTLVVGAAGIVQGDSGYERWQTVDEGEREQYAASKGLFRAEKVSEKAWQKINGVCYNGSGKKIPGAITRGIDVSEWQDVINWDKVKEAGIDFAFVRVAHGVGYLDKLYDTNMEDANAAGVPVGVYIYSTATTTAGALKEAQLVISKLKGYKVSYPVVFDLEYSRMGELTKKEIANLALTFCKEIKKAGYYPMVYCNTYWYSEKIDWSLLTGIDVWIARYGDSIDAPSSDDYNYTIWQSTDGDGGGVLNPTKGLIPGIPAGNNVDINFGFADYTRIVTPRTQPLASYKPTEIPDPTPVLKNGWKDEDGKTYYYKNGIKCTGWQKIEGEYYYFNSVKGFLYKNTLLTSRYKNICYVNERGARVSNTWVDWNGKRYYMASNGYAVKSFYKINGKTYYFSKTNAYLVKNCKLVTNSGIIYYIDSSGLRCENKFCRITSNGTSYTYYFGSNGRAYKGWHTINGKKYYFYKGNSRKSGARAENVTLTSSTGVVSVFDKNGVCIRQYKK